MNDGTPLVGDSASTNAFIQPIYDIEKNSISKKSPEPKVKKEHVIKKTSTQKVIERFEKPVFDTWDKPRNRKIVVEKP